MQTLKEYIESRYNGSQSDFAKAQNTDRQHIYRCLKHGGYYVAEINGGLKLLIVKRELNMIELRLKEELPVDEFANL